MIETITPAGCGGRRRQLVALAWFAAGAVLSAATIGALAGWGGAFVGRPVARAGAATVALLAVAGALASRRLLPQRTAQVPEPWRRERLLWQWSSGYGAILGAGFLTYQPLAAAWVAIAASAGLASPLAGATAMAAYALGRVAMVAAPNVGRHPRAGSVVARERPARLGAILIFVVGSCVFAGQALGAARPPEIDATATGSVVALTRIVGAKTFVILRRSGHPSVVLAGASQPSLDGPRLAVRDSEGIRVLDWATGRTLVRIRGRVTTPALSWPRMAFRRRAGNQWLLIVRDLRTRSVRTLDRRPLGVDLGRPAIRGRLVAWHVTSATESLLLAAEADGRVRVVLRSTTRVAHSPAIGNARLAWVEDDAACSRVLAGPISGGPSILVAARPRTTGVFWNVHLGKGATSVTVWQPARGTARIARFPIGRGPIDGCALTASRTPLPPISG